MKSMASGSVCTADRTSRRMSRVRKRDTAPEIALRRELFGAGARYRVDHPLPGLSRRRADLAFLKARVAVFVDGCFWHSCPVHGTRPRVNGTWWHEKLARNVARDRDTDHHLRSLGWRVVRIWEHEDPAAAATRIMEIVRRR